MAFGKWPRLTPIVIHCKFDFDAIEVNKLNDVFDRHPSRDAHRIAYDMQGFDLEMVSSPVYAIRVAAGGQATGIWIGYDWYVRLYICTAHLLTS